MSTCERITGFADVDRTTITDRFRHRINGEKRDDGQLIVRCGYPAEWIVQFGALSRPGREHHSCSPCLAAVVKSVGSHVYVRTTLPLSTFAKETRP